MSWIVKILAVLALFSCALSLSMQHDANKVDIEYCGACGYAGPANRVKLAVQKAFPGV